MDQIFGVTLLALQLLSCVLIYKSVKIKIILLINSLVVEEGHISLKDLQNLG